MRFITFFLHPMSFIIMSYIILRNHNFTIISYNFEISDGGEIKLFQHGERGMKDLSEVS